MATKNAQKNAYEALQRLMDDPGSKFEIWDDLLMVTTDDPLADMKNTLLALPQYDDRAAALVYGAMLEHSLEQALSTHFVADPKTAQRVFSYSADGPLASFHSKILLGLALGIYDARMFDDLKLLKQIRNAFAHAKLRIDFYTPAVIAACESLHYCPKGRPSSPLAPSRETFTFAVAFLSSFLHSDPSTPRKFQGSQLYEKLYGSMQP